MTAALDTDCAVCGRPGRLQPTRHVTHRDTPDCPPPPADVRHPHRAKRKQVAA